MTPPKRTWQQRVVRAAVLVAAAAAIIFVLFTEVFPRIERQFEDPTFDIEGAPAPAGARVG